MRSSISSAKKCVLSNLKRIKLTKIPRPSKGWGRGVLSFVHRLSRMTIDPRIPTMPGRSTSGFHQPGRNCLHPALNAVRRSASRMKGETASFQEPRIRQTSASTLCLLSCLWTTAPMSRFVFWCVHSRYSDEYYHVTASWVPHHIHTT